MNWDDLRIARAVYEAGSFAAAGATLRIDQTTVARRLSRLEQDLGVILFEAVDGVRRPTAHCERIVAHTMLMAGHVEQIGKVGDEAAGPVGRRRIATTESLAADVLGPKLVPFLLDHPGLSLDFRVSPA